MTRAIVLLLALLAVSACKGGIFDGGKIIPAGMGRVSQFSVVAQDGKAGRNCSVLPPLPPGQHR